MKKSFRLLLIKKRFILGKRHGSRGFTLIEIIVVVCILALLSATTLFAVSRQKSKAQDVAMKTDLGRLKTAFEDYYDDHNCYPPADWFDDAQDINSQVFAPYLNRMLYNQKTRLPYVLEKDTTGCRWFKLYTTLNNPDDPQAVILRTLDPSLGSTLGNYGVSSGNTSVSIYYNPTTSASPTPSSNPGNGYYCSGVGNCSSFDNSTSTCSPSYSDPSCTGSNTCANIGSCHSL